MVTGVVLEDCFLVMILAFTTTMYLLLLYYCAFNDIIQGNAPLGFKYKDTEEVWEIDEATGKGRWVPV